MTASTVLASLLAAACGLVLWSLSAALGGQTEPWDSELYWSLALPVAVGVCGILGFAFPHAPWRWVLILMGTQIVVMAAAGSGIGLLPLGLVLIAALSLPAIGLALLAARLRLRITRP